MKSPSQLRALSVLAVPIFIINSAHAILDAQNNGMSDLWEKQYNNGNLYPASFLPTDDPDQDGWPNAAEAVAGTNPHLANPPDGIIATTIEPTNTVGTFTLTWNTVVGKNYRLQASSNLTNWLNVGTNIVGTSSSHTLGISAVQPDTTVPPQLFWRVVASDLDSDNDGLTNAEENIIGTNTDSADTDGDTLSDREESIDGTDALVSDSDDDGFDDSEEKIFGTNPNLASSMPGRIMIAKRTVQYNCVTNNLDTVGALTVTGSWPDSLDNNNEINGFLDIATVRTALQSVVYSNEPPDNILFEPEYNGLIESSDYRTQPIRSANAYIMQMRAWVKLSESASERCKFHYFLRNHIYASDVGQDQITMHKLEHYINIGDSTSEPLDVEATQICDLSNEGIKVVKAALIPVELLTDLNNDGIISEKDAVLRDATNESDASNDDKLRGTEFLFVNDTLSNGLWDREDNDQDKPKYEVHDDDVQPIAIQVGIEQGEVWLEHPNIDSMSFYKSKRCLPEDLVDIKDNARYQVGIDKKLSHILYMRFDGVSQFPDNDPQLSGDLVLKFREKRIDHDDIDRNGIFSETVEALRLKFTVVKEIGAVNYFHAIKDVIHEQNLRLHTRDIQNSDNEKIMRLTALDEKLSLVHPIDVYDHATNEPKFKRGLPELITVYEHSMIMSANYCWHSVSDAECKIKGWMTDRCEGRIVIGGQLLLPTSSDTHHELGGALGTYFGTSTEQGNNTTWKFGTGPLPVDGSVINGMGGFSRNYYSNNKKGTEGHFQKLKKPIFINAFSVTSARI